MRRVPGVGALFERLTQVLERRHRIERRFGPGEVQQHVGPARSHRLFCQRAAQVPHRLRGSALAKREAAGLLELLGHPLVAGRLGRGQVLRQLVNGRAASLQALGNSHVELGTDRRPDVRVNRSSHEGVQDRKCPPSSEQVDCSETLGCCADSRWLESRHLVDEIEIDRTTGDGDDVEHRGGIGLERRQASEDGAGHSRRSHGVDTLDREGTR